MIKQFKAVALLIGVLLIFLFILSGLIYNHELVHQTIFHYAGMDSDIELGVVYGKTTPNGEYFNEYDNQTGELSELYLAHSINEIVFSQISPLLLAIIGLQFISVLIQLKVIRKA